MEFSQEIEFLSLPKLFYLQQLDVPLEIFRRHSNLFVPGVLTDQERQMLRAGKSVPITILDPQGISANSSIKSDLDCYVIDNWGPISRRNEFREDHTVEIYAARSEFQKLLLFLSVSTVSTPTIILKKVLLEEDLGDYLTVPRSKKLECFLLEKEKNCLVNGGFLHCCVLDSMGNSFLASIASSPGSRFFRIINGWDKIVDAAELRDLGNGLIQMTAYRTQSSAIVLSMRFEYRPEGQIAPIPGFITSIGGFNPCPVLLQKRLSAEEANTKNGKLRLCSTREADKFLLEEERGYFDIQGSLVLVVDQNGREFMVRLGSIDEILRFAKGWEKVAKDNEVKEYDFVVDVWAFRCCISSNLAFGVRFRRLPNRRDLA